MDISGKPDATSLVSRNMPPKNCVVDFGLQWLSPVNLGVIIIPGRHRSAVQSFPSKLYFCGHKTSVSYSQK